MSSITRNREQYKNKIFIDKDDDKMNEKLIEECRFCRIFDHDRNTEVVDNPILENNDFMAIVSRGAIVKGWVLVIPRIHIYSMRKFYCDDAFVHFTNSIIDMIREKYRKDCIIFEHGANCCNSLTSCGTNHAHLHVVAYDKSLLCDMKKDGLEWIQCDLNEIENIVGENEYWFYAERVRRLQNVRGYLHIIRQPESQYFRKLIANKEGCIEKFSYKEFRFEENERLTYETLMR